jgi:hypothetical protein
MVNKTVKSRINHVIGNIILVVRTAHTLKR